MEHINQVAFQKISKVQEHMASAPRLASRLANLLTSKAVSRLAMPKLVEQYVRNSFAQEFKQVDAYHMEEKNRKF